MEAHFAKSPIRLLDLRHTDPACTRKCLGGQREPGLEVARHQQREVARGAENVGFAEIGERHASQIGAWGGEELKSSF